MKNKIILLSIMILAFVFISNAQVKQITFSDFYDASNKAYKTMSERPHRSIVKTENFENGVAVFSIIKTKEQIAPDKWRVVTIEKKGNDEKVSEMMQIGTTIYTRENNGQWIANKITTGNDYGTGVGRCDCTQFTAEETFIDGVSARKLNKLEITKEEKGLTFDNNTIWYDSQGFFLRSERAGGWLEPRVETWRSVTTYEYDPKDLKIEAPIK